MKYLARREADDWRKDAESYRKKCEFHEREIREFFQPRVAELEQAERSNTISSFIASALTVIGGAAISASSLFSGASQSILLYGAWAMLLVGVLCQPLVCVLGRAPHRQRPCEP